MVVLLPILCSAAVLTAPPFKEPTSQPTSPVKTATAVYAVAGTLDVISTAAFVLRGGHEGNPILSPLQDKPLLMLSAGVATSVTTVWAWNRFVGRKHPKLAAFGLYVAAASHVYLVSRNYDQHMKRVRVRELWMRPNQTLDLTKTFSWK